MDDSSANIRPNARARIDGRVFGNEKNPLLIIDDAFENPEALVDVACRQDFKVPAHTRYPGGNAPLPAGYADSVIHSLRPLLSSAFGIPADLRLNFFGFYALATKGPEDLAPIQKIPHQDSTDPFQIAMVHYLCRGPFGGTGFFRHKATGFESVDATQRQAYVAVASAELEQNRDHLTAHTGTDTPGYELIDFSEAVFNRLILYRSHCLHAALLGTSPLPSDPSIGRLTANSFLTIVP